MTIITTSVIIALSVVFLFELPVYHNLLSAFKQTGKKPMDCIFCFSFWTSLIVLLCSMTAGLIPIIFLTPVITVLTKRILDALPITL